MDLREINTPAVLIDRDIVERNIHRFQEYCSRKGLALRPHIKTHKIVEFAQLQVGAGAVGINCQKLAEAEVMASHGLENILITFNIIGEMKLARLVALANKAHSIAVTADSYYTVDGLCSVFATADKPLEVLVECDTGGRRCGVQTPEEAVALAKHISQSPGLVFGGLMTYPAKGGTKDVQVFMETTESLLRANSLICKTITSGGTPDMWHAHEAPIVNEYRAGTYIYNDRSLVAAKTCGWEDCALSVLTTVVSSPAAGRAIIDAGSKALSSDLMGLEGYGQIVGYPQSQIIVLSEEHGHVRFPTTAKSPKIGQRLKIIPNHACAVSNLFDEVAFIRKEKIEKIVKVDARGCST